jgi:D-aspartate ligase
MGIDSRSTGAVVIGRDYGALGVIRSLGRRGIPVLLLETGRSNAGSSRFVKKRLIWPGEDDEPAQLALLLALAADQGYGGWALFPTSDESAALIARHHAELAVHFALTTPPWEIYRLAYDKRLTYELAESLGIEAPQTASPRAAADLAGRVWRFPVILKPAIKPKTNAFTAAKAWRVDTEAELLTRYAEAAALCEDGAVMIQELIPGGGEMQTSFVALCAEGRPLAWGVARRTRQLPRDFGKFSTFVETIDHPAIVAPSLRLLEAMRYTGVVEIEYKRDPRTGAEKPLDINARYWAWHTLGRRAGADFPYLQWRAIHGESFPEIRLRPGVRWMRGLTDLTAAFGAIRAGTLTLPRYLASFRPPIEFALFAPDDPIPFFTDIPTVLLRRVRAARKTRS